MADHVHVIAVVDFAAGTGEIKYVLPVPSTAPSVAGEPDARVALRIIDDSEVPLPAIHPAVSLMSCDVSQQGRTGSGGMIQQTLPVPADAARLELLLGDAIVDTFETAPPPAGWSAEAEMVVRESGGFGLAPEPGPRGVTYTVQARPLGAQEWQTLAAGQPSPDYRLDPNQFAGSTAVDVRVTRNRGFGADLVSEERAELVRPSGPALAVSTEN